MFKSKIKSLTLAAFITTIAGALITFPQESFEASIRGLNMWWEIVFPSLLPFFIISEMLIGFGVVKFIGVLLEPMMRPLFRVPGIGGFVLAMGMASGFPSGARFTARMRQENQISRIEAERLVSFTNSSNPLFIFGAVSVGFFHNSNLGIILAISHYVSNICVGLIMRFYGKEDVPKKTVKYKSISIKHALRQMHITRLQEKRPLGKLLGDAVISSIHSLLLIGGFIILFSVINKLLYHMNITDLLAKGVEFLLSFIGFPETLSTPYIAGLFEITLGSQMTSGAANASLMQQAVITSFILAFSGFSVQAQVASILAETDIRFFPFFAGRILQGFIAAFITFLVWKPVYERLSYMSKPTNAHPVFGINDGGFTISIYHIVVQWGPLFTILCLILYIFISSAKMNQQKK
ncbi:sporulation integral membrane protein YlbJ [Peribacillus sp. B-H-3]|uniref:sporulation integral membrane protein YlbJ n=1 Tax=Peribacillus sp. B-H-3 TaxID=3400420 RepID=UPI003B010C21